jgi:TrmH family RNA methyltransferase
MRFSVSSKSSSGTFFTALHEVNATAMDITITFAVKFLHKGCVVIKLKITRIPMVGKKWLKLIKSLQQKKYRNEHQLFFVEGKKVVQELLNAGTEPVRIFVYPDFLDGFQNLPVEEITPKALKSISALKNPNGVLGVFTMPRPLATDEKGWMVALDDVRDPGNLGTIVRLCDWYGIRHLICSPYTVDVYNPKVLQATMGSIARVNVVYTVLEEFLSQSHLPIYGAYMDGKVVYEEKLSPAGILVMGNEANGIAVHLEEFIKNRIAIPQYGEATAESLNVAMATGILLNEIRRG